MNPTYLIVAAACVIALAIRTTFELLQERGRVHPRNKAVFALVFVAMVVMLVSWPVMCPLDPKRVALPALVRWIGLGAATAGLLLAVGSIVQLRGVANIDHLVTTGLYSRLAHPMYAGFLLWIAGWVMAYGAVISLAVGLVAIGCVLSWRRLEDVALESSYGEDYRSYRGRTWF
jgi:protein-S-isoprenylcysteine O-methyltransferase Ste14